MLSFKPPWSVCVHVSISTATLVNPNIYRMAQTAKQCEPKLQVPALNYLSFRRSLGWHFAQSLVSRVGAETPGHLQVTSSFHTTADAAAQAGSVALLILVKHQHDSSNLIIYIVSQRHRIVSLAGHLSTSVSYVPILREPIFRQARLLCWSNPFPCNNSWIPENNVTFARMAKVFPAGPKCRSVLLLFWRICDHPWPQRASLGGWQFHNVMVWVPPLRHVKSCFSKMIVGIFDSIRAFGFQERFVVDSLSRADRNTPLFFRKSTPTKLQISWFEVRTGKGISDPERWRCGIGSLSGLGLVVLKALLTDTSQLFHASLSFCSCAFWSLAPVEYS